MKQIIADVLDFKVPTLVYETVEEGDKAANRTGAVLDECNKNLQYRGSNADARDLIEAVIEEQTGLTPNTRKETVKRDGKEVEIDVRDESEKKFVDRALASGKTTKEAVQAEVETRAVNGWSYKDGDGKEVKVGPIAVDITPRVRQPIKPPKLAQEYKAAATNLLSQADDAKINKTLSKYLSAERCVFARTNEAEKDAEVLGWLIKDYQKAKLAAGVL